MKIINITKDNKFPGAYFSYFPVKTVNEYIKYSAIKKNIEKDNSTLL